MDRGYIFTERALAICRVLYEKTDLDHGLTMPELLNELAQLGVECDRKAVYKCIEVLEKCGIPVEKIGMARNTKYFIDSRLFETAELRTIADMVSASRYLTPEDTKKYIDKICCLTSASRGDTIKRQIDFIRGIKTDNKGIVYSVDTITAAIDCDRSITFKMWQWFRTDSGLQKRFKYEGKTYHVSPYMLICADEKYYLIGFDEDRAEMRTYKVNRLENVSMTDNVRTGREAFEKRRKAYETRYYFEMFDGEEETVTLRVENYLLDVIVDRFGSEIKIRKFSEHSFETDVRVIVSPLFYGWLFGVGEGIEIVSPEKVFNGMKNRLETIKKKCFS